LELDRRLGVFPGILHEMGKRKIKKLSVLKPQISAKQTTEVNDRFQSGVANFFKTSSILPYMKILLRRNQKG
jgi:hypothetical protein